MDVFRSLLSEGLYMLKRIVSFFNKHVDCEIDQTIALFRIIQVKFEMGVIRKILTELWPVLDLDFG